MTRPKTPKDQEALDKVRAKLTAMRAGSTQSRPRRAPRDGELAHLGPAARRAELQRRYRSQPGGEAA